MPLQRRRIEDLAGQTYGRWSVTGYDQAASAPGKHRWFCRCQCGARKSVLGRLLRRGKSKSCGCLRVEMTGARFSHDGRPGEPISAHRLEYNSYISMLYRCYREQASGYEYYGGRGIGVCDRWRFGAAGMTGFQCFIADMPPRPSRKYSLDRIDNEQGYSPENCRWATASEQTRNQRKRKASPCGQRAAPVLRAS